MPAPGFGELTPRIDVFLKEHLFADIFDSDVLTYQQRELATIAALASMQSVAPQLQSHLTMGMNTGLTESQLKQVFSLIETHIGKKQAEIAKNVLLEMAAKSP
jgi:4-carboxymuconolactone decarboxylase